jgi:prepilin-type N-terminal cleavage/methylation domain-containing protein
MNKQKGFTIIELIVVIAIIAILSAIVLVNVTQYINKSKTSAIQANLSTVETSMAAYLADPANGTTNGADINTAAKVTNGCATTTPTYAAIVTSNGGALTCYGLASGSDWCAVSTTPTAVDSTTTHKNWCVDSTGFHGYSASGCTAGDTAAHSHCSGT